MCKKPKCMLNHSEIMVEYRRFQPNPPAFRVPLGLTPLNFANIFGVTKGQSLGYCAVLSA